MPTGTLSGEGKKLWEQIYDASIKDGDSEDTAAKKAWAGVKKAGWSKDEEGNWSKKAVLSEFSLAIKKASFDPKTGIRRWRADTSDIDPDLYHDNMTLELFEDFISRIQGKEEAPEEFRSEYWSGGMPYVSVSHYQDLDGIAVPGKVDDLYVDGKFLKAKGTFNETPLGIACWDALKKDITEKSDKPVRISIAFLDYKHRHKSNDYVFTRSDLDEICPQCLYEMLYPEYNKGKEFLRGLLIHLALTRVPVNERTIMEVERSMTTRKQDAESIIGEELAEELETKSAMVGKSDALVIKSEEEEVEQEIEQPVNELVEIKQSLSDLQAEIRSLMEVIRMKDKKEEKEDDEMDEEEDDEEPVKKADYEPVTADVIRSAFSDALAPLGQKMDLMIAAISQNKPNVPAVPERRSINPSIVPPVQTSQPGKPLSISDFVRKSVS